MTLMNVLNHQNCATKEYASTVLVCIIQRTACQDRSIVG